MQAKAHRHPLDRKFQFDTHARQSVATPEHSEIGDTILLQRSNSGRGRRFVENSNCFFIASTGEISYFAQIHWGSCEGCMQKIRIFLSSPGDVSDEREKAKTVVDSLRRSVAPHLDIQLEIFDWLDDVLPGAGDPQEIINNQVGDYDKATGASCGAVLSTMMHRSCVVRPAAGTLRTSGAGTTSFASCCPPVTLNLWSLFLWSASNDL